ncbi:MAG: hypothetical protein HWQ35_23560 [Nostoc sp. NMS1]|uniref:hypothetical protein n=1 Tax=Nostoc sp. NMS1 TaxID=2815388 RepID=UPI0025D16750|nr:hypothetical protein [Nostoc sp. NMS1]MBN3909413.1 hypothetical protein [Nostoc sp. NMS1]
MPKPPSRRKKTTSAASTDSTSAANSVNEDISQQVDPGSATITVTAIEVTELTQEEQSDRLHLDVAARKHKRSGLQTRKFLAHIRGLVQFW